MKVLFLDVDGVLNYSSIRRKWKKELPRVVRLGKRPPVCPVRIERVNRLLDITGAHVCMSSSWRIGTEEEWAECQQHLYDQGLRANFIGRTPDLSRQLHSGIFIGTQRGLEIKAWLNENPHVETFAIVDDWDDMEPLMDRLVRTHDSTGLTDEHVTRLATLLGVR